MPGSTIAQIADEARALLAWAEKRLDQGVFLPGDLPELKKGVARLLVAIADSPAKGAAGGPAARLWRFFRLVDPASQPVGRPPSIEPLENGEPTEKTLRNLSRVDFLSAARPRTVDPKSWRVAVEEGFGGRIAVAELLQTVRAVLAVHKSARPRERSGPLPRATRSNTSRRRWPPWMTDVARHVDELVSPEPKRQRWLDEIEEWGRQRNNGRRLAITFPPAFALDERARIAVLAAIHDAVSPAKPIVPDDIDPKNVELAALRVPFFVLLRDVVGIDPGATGLKTDDRAWVEDTLANEMTHPPAPRGVGVFPPADPGTESNRDPPKLPPLGEDDRQAWKLYQLDGWTQQRIADKLNEAHKKRYTQGSVSRMIARAKRHAEASGLTDHLPKTPQVTTVDPRRLELGPRTDGLTKAQRHKPNSD
ncbi:MAG: hypothetical protein AB1716_03290 [Planctomycetota bacterium]